jgi:hypothetical protein
MEQVVLYLTFEAIFVVYISLQSLSPPVVTLYVSCDPSSNGVTTTPRYLRSQLQSARLIGTIKSLLLLNLCKNNSSNSREHWLFTIRASLSPSLNQVVSSLLNSEFSNQQTFRRYLSHTHILTRSYRLLYTILTFVPIPSKSCLDRLTSSTSRGTTQQISRDVCKDSPSDFRSSGQSHGRSGRSHSLSG